MYFGKRISNLLLLLLLLLLVFLINWYHGTFAAVLNDISIIISSVSNRRINVGSSC